jgi:ABC-type Mn2+/Zn2+ transport system ATPase subunit
MPTAPGRNGRGERIRTSDILLPKQVRYQTAPRPGSSNSAAFRAFLRPLQGRQNANISSILCQFPSQRHKIGTRSFWYVPVMPGYWTGPLGRMPLNYLGGPQTDGVAYDPRGRGYQMIHSVDIRNYRCFKHLEIEKCSRFNVIVGDNGAGKTALLEAIFLALGSNPTLALRFRQYRGLDGTFGGVMHSIEEAMWRDSFYDGQWDLPISVNIRGDGAETRSLVISRGDPSELIIPFAEASMEPDTRSAGVQFTWLNSAGRERKYVPKINSQGLTVGGEEEEYLPDFFHFPSNQTIGSVENAARFSELSRANRLKDFVDTIREEYGWIVELKIEIVAGLPVIYATLDTGQQMPLANVSGGVNRVIGLMLAVASRPNTVILVDEIENGIYFKHQPMIWSRLAAMTRRQQGQLFITTHNEEWLEAVFEDQDVSDVALWRLERTKEGPRLRQFAGKQASAAVRVGEIR